MLQTSSLHLKTSIFDRPFNTLTRISILDSIPFSYCFKSSRNLIISSLISQMWKQRMHKDQVTFPKNTDCCYQGQVQNPRLLFLAALCFYCVIIVSLQVLKICEVTELAMSRKRAQREILPFSFTMCFPQRDSKYQMTGRVSSIYSLFV